MIELYISRFESVGGTEGGSGLGSSVGRLESGFEKRLKAYSCGYYNSHKNSRTDKSAARCQSESEKERGGRSSGANRARLPGEVGLKAASWGSHWWSELVSWTGDGRERVPSAGAGVEKDVVHELGRDDLRGENGVQGHVEFVADEILDGLHADDLYWFHG